MRPPEFWKANASGRDAALMLRALLTPVSWAYAWAAERRIASTRPRHAPVPVVCVGNLTVGGAGKTPVARALRAKLGAHAHTLSRGYGGRIAGPLRVTPDMSAAEVGDEPLLHARDGAAWIARDRHAGAMAAVAAGAHAIVMDDGFQNPSLAKNLSILVVDPAFGIGNGAVFPAGPLRERLSAGLSRAHAMVLLQSAGAEAQAPDWIAGLNAPVLRATLAPAGILPDRKLVAFAGLARPEKFFDTLAAMGARVAEAVPFDDHYAYAEADLTFLARMADDHDAMLITTEKDAVRLTPEWRARVAVLPVAARFADEAALDALLAPVRARMDAAHG
ncbi:MAG: tetraacyldisaccharide 4'-kinase [Hyphomonadaceae bacterium]|nr:tetraacyldisaccharide 4'-kinase [Hyphomonadaceae bacterium]